MDDRCTRCDLGRYEAWILDDQARAVMALVWTAPTGRPLRVRPFPYLLGMEPAHRPTQHVDQAFPGIEIGSEPACH